jgi:hypothetical protein
MSGTYHTDNILRSKGEAGPADDNGHFCVRAQQTTGQAYHSVLVWDVL